MADSSSFNMKKRGAASEGVELVEENGLKRRSCSSSPLPTGSGHDTTQAGALIEQLRWNFMTDKLRELEYEIEKRISHSINSPSCGDETEGREREREVLRDGLIKEKLPEWENEFRETVMKELDRIAQLQLKPPPPNPLSYQYERGSGSGTWKLRLHFCNQIASIMYPKDEIKGIDDNPLRLEIRDAYYNTIIDTGLLSSAPFQIFLFEEENDSKRSPDFVPADKLRELMSFKAIQVCRLENGVGSIKNLIIKPSSYWISKKFYLVVKVMDEQILMETGATIEDATSEPFTVKTNRMKGFAKHNPPTKQSEVWRLIGISKGGVYHRILLPQGITTVGDFLKKYHEMGSQALKESLGDKMSKEMWEKIVGHAKQCEGYDPTHYLPTLQADDHRADTNHNSEVHNPQNQSVEDNNNNNSVGTEQQLPNSNHNSEVHNDQNQDVKEKKYEEWCFEKVSVLLES